MKNQSKTKEYNIFVNQNNTKYEVFIPDIYFYILIVL